MEYINNGTLIDSKDLLFNELYEKTKDCGRVQFINLLMAKEREIKELKEQLEKKYEKVGTLTGYLLYEENTKLINQQKEFIEWLEDKLNMCDGFLDTVKSDLEEISYTGRASGKTYIATQIMKNETAMKCYEEVLSKYKEIIGVKDE